MITAGLFDATTGECIGRLAAPTWEILAVNAAENRIVMQIDPATDMSAIRLDLTTLEAVDLLPVSVSLLTPTAPAAVDLSGLPDGVVVTVANEMGDRLTLTTPEALTLIDPGVYRLTASTPFTHVDLDAELEVTNG